MVLQRAPRCGLQVPAGHRRLRGGPRQRAPLRPPARRRGRRGRARAQHDRGHQPSRLPAPARAPTTWWPRPWSSTTPTCCPGPGWRRGAGWSAAPTAPSAPTTSSRCSTTGGRPALLAITGASNVTGWLPPVEEICAAAHERGVPVLLDAAQLAPHRPLPAGPDFMAFSGHKLYAPFGAGALDRPAAHVRDRRSLPRRRRRGRPGRPRRGDLDRASRARGGGLAQRRRGRRLRHGDGRAGADRLGRHRCPRGDAVVAAARRAAGHRGRPRAGAARAGRARGR